jgi:hypothetical protein
LPFEKASIFHFSIPIRSDNQEELLLIFVLLVHIRIQFD